MRSPAEDGPTFTIYMDSRDWIPWTKDMPYDSEGAVEEYLFILYPLVVPN
jgi:hypothetical protein